MQLFKFYIIQAEAQTGKLPPDLAVQKRSKNIKLKLITNREYI